MGIDNNFKLSFMYIIAEFEMFKLFSETDIAVCASLAQLSQYCTEKCFCDSLIGEKVVLIT